MTNATELQDSLLRLQNADGGWPLGKGCSWTESTALALLALQSLGYSGKPRPFAASWLATRQSSSGGWPPCEAVSTNTWVTSLALLALLGERSFVYHCRQATQWVKQQVFPPLPSFRRFIQSRLGLSNSQVPGGVPWFPGTAGWVIPTSLSILALSSAARTINSQNNIHQIVSQARSYLMARRCIDGGWNHGGSLLRSEQSASYAETTGLALLAMAGHPAHELSAGLRLSKTFLDRPDSSEGLSWTIMGLTAHGMNASHRPYPQSHTSRDVALQIIALRSLDGVNPFLPRAS